MKFATNSILHYPPHFRHVATLPWEIKNQIFCRYSTDMDENGQNLTRNVKTDDTLAKYYWVSYRQPEVVRRH